MREMIYERYLYQHTGSGSFRLASEAIYCGLPVPCKQTLPTGECEKSEDGVYYPGVGFWSHKTQLWTAK